MDETRKESEARSAAVDSQLRAVFEHAAIGIAYASLDGRFLDANRKFATILGFSRDEVLRLGFRDVTHPDDLAMTVDYTRRLAAGELDEHVVEKRFVRKDG